MVDPERFELSTSTLQGLHSPGLSYGPIKAGLLSIKHPIGSEFHIITHNESLYLTTIGFIIVATLGVFLLPPIIIYLINPIGFNIKFQ